MTNYNRLLLEVKDPRVLNTYELFKPVANVYGVHPKEIENCSQVKYDRLIGVKTNRRPSVMLGEARQIICYLAKICTLDNVNEISLALNYGDHSHVTRHYNKVKEWIKIYPDLQQRIADIEKEILTIHPRAHISIMLLDLYKYFDDEAHLEKMFSLKTALTSIARSQLLKVSQLNSVA